MCLAGGDFGGGLWAPTSHDFFDSKKGVFVLFPPYTFYSHNLTINITLVKHIWG
ncbi:hypothetical protein HanIR_Chr05g0249101 [Helianthus annuus]|nr:hypothetical protein HanIR_Chr05g0249101 [Helianthus annuus]